MEQSKIIDTLETYQSAVEKRKVIGEEVAQLLAAEFIREIYHS